MDEELLAKAKVELDKAKVRLMRTEDSVFFATLCFSMKHVWDERLPTAACDGKTVFWNPNFFMSLADVEERVFLMLHETMHAAYLHMDPVRMNGRCPDRWNIACDHVINLQLMARGFKMPTGVNKGLADAQFIGMSAEEVYALLPANPGKPQMPDLLEPGANMEELRGEIQDALIRASIQSKLAGDKPGTIPGEVEIFLEKLLNPKLPWYKILRKYMQSFAKSDYTFKRPNRRFFPKHHLPSLYSDNLSNLTVAVDTSGSVSDQDFLRFISEIGGILKMMKPELITLIQFDTAIKAIDKVPDFSALSKVKFTGRGGTNIVPVLQWANENKPQLLLVFTDGEFNFYEQDTKVQTLWLIHENPHFKTKFGKVIHYEL